MTPTTNPASSLIDALMQADLYEPPVDHIQLIETHISWVILTGRFVYKIKKPVDLGFLDFSTLEKRRFFCEEEVRLNRRLAPDTYLEVVPITGTPEQPCWAGAGEAIEYAVKMVQFPQQAQLDRMLDRGELKSLHLDTFARLIADFHQEINCATGDAEYGDLEHLYRPVKENISQLREQVSSTALHDKLDKLQDWSARSVARLKPVFEQRKEAGYIRECHGDMHLRNMAWVDAKPLLFDCIEFNPNLRWIDVISETAFLVMDLHKREQFHMGQRFLNSYLERTGDYGGVRVLPFYLVYRALVRAKVEAIRAGQSDLGPEEQASAEQALQEYLQLAESYTQPHQLRLVLTHGLSACGKTTITRPLLERLGAIRIRSDVERKRLFGLQAQDSGQAGINQGMYSAQASRQTYDKLAKLAEQVLDGGFSVIIDAACLNPEQRARFQALAAAQRIPYLILDITALEATLRQRIQQRSKGASDADLKVLEHQLKTAQKLKPDEETHAIAVDTEAPLELEKLAQEIEASR